MKTGPPSLSVIILMYNEARSIESTLTETSAFLASQLSDWEIIVVDDGSTDDGADIVRKFGANRDDVRLVSHETNRGMGAGMATGIGAATKQYLIFNAADGQIRAAEIAKMLPLLSDADIVLTRWDTGRETVFRGALSAVFRVFLRRVACLDGELEGLYLFPVAYARELAPGIRAKTFLFSFALIQKGLDAGLTKAATSIHCLPRVTGKSKTLRLSTIVRVALEGLQYRLSRH